MAQDASNSQLYWNSRFSDDWARKGGHEQSEAFAKLALEYLPGWLAKELAYAARTICDWGCADGDGTKILAQAFPKASLVGVDFSGEAIANAARRFPEIRFFQANEDSLDESFDVVFSSNTLEHFSNPLEVLEKLAARARCYIVLLLPFRECARIDEHLYTFDYNSFRLRIKNFYLVSYRVVDCCAVGNSVWPGQQILITYANSDAVDISTFDLATIASGADQRENRLLQQVEDYHRLSEATHAAKEDQAVHLEQWKAEADRLANALHETQQMLQQAELGSHQEAFEKDRLKAALAQSVENLQQRELDLAISQQEAVPIKAELASFRQTLHAEQLKLKEISSSAWWKMSTRYETLRRRYPLVETAHSVLSRSLVRLNSTK